MQRARMPPATHRHPGHRPSPPAQSGRALHAYRAAPLSPVHAAIRQNQVPLTLADVASRVSCDPRSVGRHYRAALQVGGG